MCDILSHLLLCGNPFLSQDYLTKKIKEILLEKKDFNKIISDHQMSFVHKKNPVQHYLI